jgi:hypothetical protein
MIGHGGGTNPENPLENDGGKMNMEKDRFEKTKMKCHQIFKCHLAQSPRQCSSFLFWSSRLANDMMMFAIAVAACSAGIAVLNFVSITETK